MMKMSSASTANLTPITLRFGVFFDGTGNNQHNAMTMGEQGDKGGSYGNALSNVALLHALYPADAAYADGPQAFLKRYVEGVGTLAGEADHVYASATGHGRTGAEARVAEALQGMAEQLQAWRRAHPQATLEGVEFDLFGFSRGAAAVRHLANLLHEGAGGLLSVACETSINFIGLFDTVAAIIAPYRVTSTLQTAATVACAWAWVRVLPGTWCNWWPRMSGGITSRWCAVATTSCCRACTRILGVVTRRPFWSRCCCASRSPSVCPQACVSSSAASMPR